MKIQKVNQMFRNYNKSDDVTFDQANDYQQWLSEAKAYDQENGLERWKSVDQTSIYDHKLVRLHLDKILRMRANNDNAGLLFVLNEGIHGNLGGMGNEVLYTKAKSGPKKLVENYINELCSALEHLADSAVTDISFATKLDFFNRAQECFGHSALMLSGSGSLIYFHIGVVLALAEQGILPKVISGSSGGAFIGTMLCSYPDEELESVFDLDNFADAEMLKRHAGEEKSRRGLKLPSLKPGAATLEDFEKSLERLIPDLTFQDALKITGRQLNVSIASAENAGSSRLLNAKTSPNVFLRGAVRASAAAPGIFPPASLSARDEAGNKQAYLPEQKWVDGSLSGDLPSKRLARLYGVNHFIVSQTNPHIVPFVTDAKRKRDVMSVLKYASFDTARTWANTGAALWRKPMASSERLTKVSHTLLSIINQNYKGDINILPPQKYFNPMKQFGWMSRKDMEELIDAGRRATWPKIEMIRLQSKVSRTLERITNELHREVVERSRRTRS